jgi:glycosyltransferase involved in cell wall biosynthesis
MGNSKRIAPAIGSSAGAAPAQRVVVLGSFAFSLVHFRGALIAELVRRGHQVYAMAPAIGPEIARQLIALGATPVEVELGRTSLNPLAGMRTVRSIRRALAQIAPDVVIAYTIKPIVLGAAAARSAGVKRFVALVTGLGYAFTGGREPKRLLAHVAARLMYRRAFGNSAMAVFQNPDDRADFTAMGLLPKRLPTFLVDGSGIDVGLFTPSPVPAEPSFLMIARLLGDKGVREFGTAARRLKQLHPEVRISLAGWIDPAPNALTQAELDGLIADGIDFLGWLDDVRPAIAQHSVYVLPSYREGTPRSVLEAMACGRAIITTDAPGCRETVVPGENGLLVPPRDADALLRAMLHFIEEPAAAARMGAASRALAERKYDVRLVNEALLGHAGL